MVTVLALWILLSFAVVVGALLVAAGLAVSWLRHWRAWRAPGLIMHELICPMGELQDPEFADRRRWAAGQRQRR